MKDNYNFFWILLTISIAIFLIFICGCSSHNAEVLKISKKLIEVNNIKDKLKEAVSDKDSQLKVCSEYITQLKEEYNKLRKHSTLSINNLQKKIEDIKKKSIKSLVWNVKKGDWLSKISDFVYGDYRLWTIIYNNNKSIISNPDLIYPGQKLNIELTYDSYKRKEAIKRHDQRYSPKL